MPSTFGIPLANVVIFFYTTFCLLRSLWPQSSMLVYKGKINTLSTDFGFWRVETTVILWKTTYTFAPKYVSSFDLSRAKARTPLDLQSSKYIGWVLLFCWTVNDCVPPETTVIVDYCFGQRPPHDATFDGTVRWPHTTLPNILWISLVLSFVGESTPSVSLGKNTNEPHYIGSSGCLWFSPKS